MSVLQENNESALIIYIFICFIQLLLSLNLKYCQPIVFRNMKLLPACVVKACLCVYVYIFFQRWNLSSRIHLLGTAIKQTDLNGLILLSRKKWKLAVLCWPFISHLWKLPFLCLCMATYCLNTYRLTFAELKSTNRYRCSFSMNFTIWGWHEHKRLQMFCTLG